MNRSKAQISVKWALIDRIYVAYSCLAMQLQSAQEFMNQDQTDKEE